MSEKFKMPHRNTCTSCGKVLVRGDDVFAENEEEVSAGKGKCKACAFPKKGKEKQEVEE